MIRLGYWACGIKLMLGVRLNSTDLVYIFGGNKNSGGYLKK